MAYANNPKIVSTPSGEVFELLHGAYEADSQSFTVGELVYTDVTATNPNLVTACASDATTIMGIAKTAATNTTTDHVEILIEKIKPTTVVKMRCTNNGTDATTANFIRGRAYGIYVASNVHYADINDTTNDAVVYQGPDTDESGAEGYWGLFKFLPTVCQSSTGA